MGKQPKIEVGEVRLREFKDTPISISITKTATKPGCWAHNDVRVFKDGVDIGGYTYNYSSFSNTFYPFQAKNDEWFALYSLKYTATRVARLEEGFEDWCGEEPGTFGFCPVEFYVPKLTRFYMPFQHYNADGEPNGKIYGMASTIADNDPEELEKYDQEMISREQKERVPGHQYNERLFDQYSKSEFYADYGFMSGCVWGDDGSWKIRMVDLSSILDKKVNVIERFGYIEVPRKMTLPECLQIHSGRYVTITHEQEFCLDEEEE